MIALRQIRAVFHSCVHEWHGVRMEIRRSPQRLAPVLWLLLIAFVMRVVGQILVAWLNVVWLPPMEDWMSGRMPYRYLLPSQVLIIGVLGKICLDFSRGGGWFVCTRPMFGRPVLYVGYAYFAAMIVRYVAGMSLHPEARWFGGTIPIVLHMALATFLILFASWHRARLAVSTGSQGSLP